MVDVIKIGSYVRMINKLNKSIGFHQSPMKVIGFDNNNNLTLVECDYWDEVGLNNKISSSLIYYDEEYSLKMNRLKNLQKILK